MDVDHSVACQRLEMANREYSIQQDTLDQNPITPSIGASQEHKSHKRIQSKPHQPSDSPLSKSNSTDALSSLAKRLNQMSVKERENALYELHGIPLDDEYYDQELGVNGNKIEKDPKQLSMLLQEQDRLVEERLKTDKIDGEPFGRGIKLARQQNLEYFHAQRIRFLRADRYDANLASTRMIRFFDLKRELFCGPGYNQESADGSTNAIINCMGRDLRLSDFSKEDLEMWKRTGFFQLCGMRDRAKRAIVTFFGKVVAKENIPAKLVMRAYMYACNLWSQEELTQKTGFVLIGYTVFNDLHLRGPITKSSYEDNEALVEKYLTSTASLLGQMVNVGLCAQLRGVSQHFCHDHRRLYAQFEKLAAIMTTFTAARFRCHYANTKIAASKVLSSGGDENSRSCASGQESEIDSLGNFEDSKTSAGSEQSEKFNPHNELLYTLMTFGIPRETIPFDDATGEVNLEYHRAVITAIEEQERKDRFLEEATTAQAVLANDMQAAASLAIPTTANQFLISQTASVKPGMAIAEFEKRTIGSPMSAPTGSNANQNLISAKEQYSKKVNETRTVMVPSPNDIVMGRGPWNKSHTGNLRLKAMLERDRHQYDVSNRFERMRIVDCMLTELYENHGSRFLYKDTTESKKDNGHDGTLPPRRKNRSNSHTTSGRRPVVRGL